MEHFAVIYQPVIVGLTWLFTILTVGFAGACVGKFSGGVWVAALCALGVGLTFLSNVFFARALAQEDLPIWGIIPANMLLALLAFGAWQQERKYSTRK